MKNIYPFILFTICAILLSACLNTGAPSTPVIPATNTPIPPTSTVTPYQTATLKAPLATIVINLDLGNGGAGFSANMYAQEISTGKTFGVFLSAGMHGAAALPTAAPMILLVEAPGTYVFYARLSNAPTDYFYGYTDCVFFNDCDQERHKLKAVDVFPGMTYRIILDGDRKVILPERDVPVTVPWGK